MKVINVGRNYLCMSSGYLAGFYNGNVTSVVVIFRSYLLTNVERI